MESAISLFPVTDEGNLHDLSQRVAHKHTPSDISGLDVALHPLGALGAAPLRQTMAVMFCIFFFFVFSSLATKFLIL